MKIEVPEYLIETIWAALRSSLNNNANQIKAVDNPITKELFRQRGYLLFDAEKIFYEYHLQQED